MRLNRRGRAIWTDPPEGQRRGAFVAEVDPDTLPRLATVQAPSAPSEAPAQEPSEAPAQEPAPPEPEPDAWGALPDGLGGVPLPEAPAAPMQVPELQQGEPGEPDSEPSEAPADVPELEDAAAPATSEEPARVSLVLGETEASGLATVHELLINRWVAKFPRQYSARERQDVGRAIAAVLERYAHVGEEHVPLANLAMVTVAVGMERWQQGCPQCGEVGSPPGSRFCVGCGAAIEWSAGGPCVAYPQECVMEELPAGTRHCPACGVGQSRGGVRHDPARSEGDDGRE